MTTKEGSSRRFPVRWWTLKEISAKMTDSLDYFLITSPGFFSLGLKNLWERDKKKNKKTIIKLEGIRHWRRRKERTIQPSLVQSSVVVTTIPIFSLQATYLVSGWLVSSKGLTVHHPSFCPSVLPQFHIWPTLVVFWHLYIICQIPKRGKFISNSR